MASPAQVANDMQAWATFWWKRDKDVANACQDAALIIRAYLGGSLPDGRAVGGVLMRLYRLDGEYPVVGSADTRASLARAAATIRDLRKGYSA